MQAFHEYLSYIHGRPAADNPFGGEEDSKFEELVAEKLITAGYRVVPQVGVALFRIDLGIQHESCPIGFIAGVECDGAPYHSSATVRDRDRIRQQQLLNLGWHIYRVWSVDWFANPEGEMARLLKWLGQIRDKIAAPRGMAASVPNLLHTSEHPDAANEDVAIGEVDEESPHEPVGQKQRLIEGLNGIDWFEEEKGYRYTVWAEEGALGELTVLSRGNRAARLYGGQIYAPKPEYEGWVYSTDERFKTNDIYAAVRGSRSG